MKHAGSAALDELEPLLAELRRFAALREKTRGVFYRGGKAFLHFHEDPAGLFADMRDADRRDFARRDITSRDARLSFLGEVRERLAL
jgi:hypothetical protein